MTHPLEPVRVLIGLTFAALGAYARYSGEAGFPYIAGFWITKKKDRVIRYWLVVVSLFLCSAISFLQAWKIIVI
jgi:hypothetical protein